MSRPRGRKYKPAYLFAGVSGTNGGQNYSQWILDQDPNAGTDQYNYGDRTVNNANRFKRYQDMIMLEPLANLSLMELGLAIGKGLEIRFPEDDKPSEADSMLKMANDFSYKINLPEKFNEAGRLMGTDGTVLPLTVYFGEGDKDKKGDVQKGVKKVQFSPMAYTTIISEGYKPGEGLGDIDFGALMGDPAYVVLNEKLGDARWKVFEPDQFVVIRNSHENYEIKDIYGRNTIGLYGISLLDPLQGTIKNKYDILDAYVAAIERYGHMKLWFEYEALQNLIENQNINMRDAQVVLDKVKTEIKKINRREDIVTAGFKINPIESGSISMDIMAVQAQLDKTITNCLLGCDAGNNGGQMGGNTYASSYVDEQRKVLVIEAMRLQVRKAFEEIIARHLVENGYNEKDARKIRIYLDPVTEPNVTPNDMLLAYKEQLITDQQYFDVLGINLKGEGKKIPDDRIKSAQMGGGGVPGAKPTGGSKTSPSTVKNTQKNMYEAKTSPQRK